MITYGYLGYKGVYYDLSNTLKGARISATKRGIKEIYKRTGYNFFLECTKTPSGWIDAKKLL